MKLSDQLSLAARVAGCSELRDVRMFEVEASLESPAYGDLMSYNLDTEVTNQVLGDEGDQSMIVSGVYALSIYDVSEGTEDENSADAEDSDPVELGRIEFTLAGLYSLSPGDGVELGDDELDAFAQTTGQLALYPYAREFIADMTRRMGLPGLHLGNLQLKLDSRTGD